MEIYHGVLLILCSQQELKNRIVAEVNTAGLLNHAEKERYVDHLTLLEHILDCRVHVEWKKFVMDALLAPLNKA